MMGAKTVNSFSDSSNTLRNLRNDNAYRIATIELDQNQWLIGAVFTFPGCPNNAMLNLYVQKSLNIRHNYMKSMFDEFGCNAASMLIGP